jgi:serpin B
MARTQLSPLVAGGTAFALDLFRQLRHTSGNLFFSPLAIRIGLEMAGAGARGATAAQMRETLHLAGDGADGGSAAQLLDRLSHPGFEEYVLDVASSIWIQDGYEIERSFVDALRDAYGSNVHRADFRQAAEAARRAINDFVAEKTRQRIQDLIPTGLLDLDTRLVLANAIYMKAAWAHKFSPERTRDEPFHRLEGGTVHAPLMRQDDDLLYMRGRGFQAVDISYLGGELSMLVILPDAKDGLGALEETLTDAMLQGCVAELDERPVTLFLPRFTMTWGTDLVGGFTRTGMTLPFDPDRGDFSGINGLKAPHPDALVITAALHKAFVETTEEGTEAAAAMAVIMSRSLAMPRRKPPRVTFRADHPFWFAIRDRRSGVFLFLGRVTDPMDQA